MKNKNIELEKYKYGLLIDLLRELPEDRMAEIIERCISNDLESEIRVGKGKLKSLKSPFLGSKKTKRKRRNNEERIIKRLSRNKTKGYSPKEIHKPLKIHHTTFYNIVNKLVKQKKVKKYKEGKNAFYKLRN